MAPPPRCGLSEFIVLSRLILPTGSLKRRPPAVGPRTGRWTRQLTGVEWPVGGTLLQSVHDPHRSSQGMPRAPAKARSRVENALLKQARNAVILCTMCHDCAGP